ARGRAGGPSVLEPGAAPQHAARLVRKRPAHLVRIRQRPGSVGSVPVPAPFVGVPRGVVEAVAVRLLVSHRLGARPRGRLEPGDRRRVAAGLSGVEAGRRSAPGGILPLRLAGQADRAPRLPRKPRGEGQGVGVGDEHDGVFVRLREPGVAPGELLALYEAAAVEAEAAGGALLGLGAVAGLLHEAGELSPGDLVLSDVEVPAEGDLSLALVVVPAGLGVR